MPFLKPLGLKSPYVNVFRIKWTHVKFLVQFLAGQVLIIIIIIIIFVLYLNFSDHVFILGSENMFNIIIGLIEFLD